jgi:hypothetical protein
MVRGMPAIEILMPESEIKFWPPNWQPISTELPYIYGADIWSKTKRFCHFFKWILEVLFCGGVQNRLQASALTSIEKTEK